MALRGPLRYHIFPFSKRRHLESRSTRSGSRESRPIASASDAFPAAGGSVPSSVHETYDPVHAQYLDAGQPYEEPDSWFEGMHIPPTPQPLGHPAADAEMADEDAQYTDGLMTPELMEQLLSELGHVFPASEPDDIEGIAEDADAADQHMMEMSDLEVSLDHMEAPPDYDACQMTQEMFDQQMEQALDAPEPELQPDPQEQMEEMHEQELERMLNPFMMPGMGPGPRLG